MDKRVNQGYVITDQIQVGNKVFVLGECDTSPTKFVTWQSYADNPNSYDWGHYKDSRISALEDLCKRALSEIEIVKENSRPRKIDHAIEKRWESYTPIGKALALEMYDKGKKIYIDFDLAKSRREIENAADDSLKSPDVKRYQKELDNKKRNEHER